MRRKIGNFKLGLLTITLLVYSVMSAPDNTLEKARLESVKKSKIFRKAESLLSKGKQQSNGPINIITPPKAKPLSNDETKKKMQEKVKQIPKLDPKTFHSYCKGDDLELILHPKSISKLNMAIVLIFITAGFVLLYLSTKMF